MTIDYDQLKTLVKEAMFTGGGINEPSAPEGIPIRMPAAEPSQEEGDPEANALYDVALRAREATEELVAALEDPTFDDTYEYAFKASACLRKALNSLEGMGAHPAPQDRVVAPPSWAQKYNSGGGDYGGGGMLGYAAGLGGFEEGLKSKQISEIEEDPTKALTQLGIGTMSKSQQGKEKRDLATGIASGEELAGVKPNERKMLQQLEQHLLSMADKGDLTAYKQYFIKVLKPIIKQIEDQVVADK